MEVPALAVGGVAPVLPPLLVLFLIMVALGSFMFAAALIWRNLLLVSRGRLKALSITDLSKAADPGFSTRPAGAKPFIKTLYARLALIMLVIGGAGFVASGFGDCSTADRHSNKALGPAACQSPDI